MLHAVTAHGHTDGPELREQLRAIMKDVEQSSAALAQARARLGLSPEGSDDKVDPEQTATVRQARALLNQANFDRERAAKLVEQGVISRASFDSVDAAYKVAQGRYQDALEEIRNRQALLSQRRSELALARQQLADTSVYAPLDGTVQEKRTSVGEYLAAGAPVVSIVKVDPLRLRAEVPEREAPHVHEGQRVQVTVEGDPVTYQGQIKRLSPSIREQNRILVVEADVRNNGRLRPGSFDGLPYLGSLPGLKNAYVAAGHFRSGLFLSTATAIVMSEYRTRQKV